MILIVVGYFVHLWLDDLSRSDLLVVSTTAVLSCQERISPSGFIVQDNLAACKYFLVVTALLMLYQNTRSCMTRRNTCNHMVTGFVLSKMETFLVSFLDVLPRLV